jgi:hypothetical protein
MPCLPDYVRFSGCEEIIRMVIYKTKYLVNFLSALCGFSAISAMLLIFDQKASLS